jgi:hypothetical protein
MCESTYQPTELDKLFNSIEDEFFIQEYMFRDLVKILCKLSKQSTKIDLSIELAIVIENVHSEFIDIYDEYKEELKQLSVTDAEYQSNCEYFNDWITQMCDLGYKLTRFGIDPIPYYPKPELVFT